MAPLSDTIRRLLGLGILGAAWTLLVPAPGPARADDPARLERGRVLFAHPWEPNDPRSKAGDGLGPVFNERSCLACHDRGGPGGSGSGDRNIEILTAAPDPVGGGSFSYAFGFNGGGGRFEYRFPGGPSRRGPLDHVALSRIHAGFRRERSVVLHRFSTDPTYLAWRAQVPERRGSVAIGLSLRNPPPTFGAGLIDALPDRVFEASAARRFPSWPRVKGRVSRLADGRIGRFGWKAQTATLQEFVLSACAVELGLDVPGHPQAADPRGPAPTPPGLDLDEEDCRDLVAYVRALPRPSSPAATDHAEALRQRAGRAVFRAIGCDACHRPDLGPIRGIYSDLLLHDMSPELGDTGSYGVFTAEGDAPAPGGRSRTAGAHENEWRTPPLWGLRDSAPYLHDGRAATIAEAIQLHGGEAAPSARAFAHLSRPKREQLAAFLDALAAPPPPDRAP